MASAGVGVLWCDLPVLEAGSVRFPPFGGPYWVGRLLAAKQGCGLLRAVCGGNAPELMCCRLVLLQIQMQGAGRKEGEPPCAISLPSIRMGFAAKDGADKAAAIEQWGLAALKPGLFVDAQLRNPGTPASNADTPKAANSPPLPASGEEDDAPPPQHQPQACVPSKDAPGSSKENMPVKEESVQMPVDLAMVAEHFAAVIAAEAAASAEAVQVERAMEPRTGEPACRQEAERRESEERDAARKRKAEEMGLGELGADELLAAEILSGSFMSGLPHRPLPPSSGASGGKGRGGRASRGGGESGNGAREGKRARQASAKAAAASLLEVPLRVKSGGGAARGRASGVSKQAVGKSSASKAPVSCAVVSKGKMGGAGKPGGSGLDEGAGASVASWVSKVVGFLETNGQDLLSSICAHYRIDFCGDVSSIRDYSLEQLAHNAIFNPALPKAAGRLPKMLRDTPGVSNWSVGCGVSCVLRLVRWRGHELCAAARVQACKMRRSCSGDASLAPCRLRCSPCSRHSSGAPRTEACLPPWRVPVGAQF